MKAIFSVFGPRGTPWPKKRKNRLHFDVFFDPKFRLNPLGYRIDPKNHISAHPSAPPRDPPNPTICAAHPSAPPRDPRHPTRTPKTHCSEFGPNSSKWGIPKNANYSTFPSKSVIYRHFSEPPFFEIFPFIRMCFLRSISVPQFNLI